MSTTKKKKQPKKVAVNPMRAAFPKGMQKARDLAGISQAALAERMGCTVSYVSMLENGKRCPTLDTIHDVSVALDASVRSLLGV